MTMLEFADHLLLWAVMTILLGGEVGFLLQLMECI
jgi:hypothetical protein